MTNDYAAASTTVQRWGVFEVAFPGKTEGNPFVDHAIKGIFAGDAEQMKVSGFYDGNGVYKIRFMPSFEGRYRYHANQLHKKCRFPLPLYASRIRH